MLLRGRTGEGGAFELYDEEIKQLEERYPAVEKHTP